LSKCSADWVDFVTVSVSTKKKQRTVDDDDDDIMLPLRQRRLPSFIAIDDTTSTLNHSETGFY